MGSAAQGDIGINKFHDATEKTYFEKLMKSTNKYYWIPKDVLDRDTVMQLGLLVSESIIEENYIGSGSFGGVSLCKVDGVKKKCVTKTMYAVAVTEDIKNLQAELETLDLASKGKFIPKMYWAGFNHLGFYTIVMECIGGSTLSQHIKNITSREAIKIIALQLAKALTFLHRHHRTHGDLKPDNIGLTERGHVKLFDFGKSRYVSNPCKLPRGTLYYDAPELIKGEKADCAIDWWSYGCVVAELIQKDILYQYDGGDIYVESLILGFPPDLRKFDDETKNFLLELLEKDPANRLKDAWKHKFFNGIASDAYPEYSPRDVVSKINRPTPWKTLEDRSKYFKMSKLIEDAIISASLLRYPTRLCTKFMNKC